MEALIVVVAPGGTQGIKGLPLPGSGLHVPLIQTPAKQSYSAIGQAP